MKKRSRQELEDEPEYIIIDEYARVFAGLKRGEPFFSEDIDDAKPLQGQSKFEFMKTYYYIKIEQMFLEKKDVRKKRRNRKTRVSF